MKKTIPLFVAVLSALDAVPLDAHAAQTPLVFPVPFGTTSHSEGRALVDPRGRWIRVEGPARLTRIGQSRLSFVPAAEPLYRPEMRAFVEMTRRIVRPGTLLLPRLKVWLRQVTSPSRPLEPMRATGPLHTGAGFEFLDEPVPDLPMSFRKGQGTWTASTAYTRVWRWPLLRATHVIIAGPEDEKYELPLRQRYRYGGARVP
jgi:hypothetical protein